MTSLGDRTSLEDRINAATRAAADTVLDGSAPPLRLPTRPRSKRTGLRYAWTSAPGRAGLLRLAAPLAAAAAVIAVVAASLAVTGGSHPPAPTAGAGLAGVPPYYLTLVSYDSTGIATISGTVSASMAPATTASSPSPAASYSSAAPTTSYSSPAPTTSYSSPAPTTSSVLGTTGRQYAVIRDVVTGATVAAFRPPRPFETFDYATGAADDRTFVLAAQNLSKDSRLMSCGPTGMFLARLDPVVRTVTLTPLPMLEFPATSRIDGIALSPDGTRLAVALASGQRCSANGAVMVSPLKTAIKNAAAGQEQVRVYSLPSGTVKTWQSAPQWELGGEVGTGAMSWTQDGMLAFNYPGAGGGPSGQGLRLLNTNAPGGSLLGDSRFVVSVYLPPGLRVSHDITSQPAGRWAWTSDGLITPDGKTVVAPIERHLERPGVTGAAFADFAASTGREVGVRWPEQQLARNPFFLPYYSVVWTNSSGSVLVVAAPPTRGGKEGAHSVYGVLSGDRFTPIPGAPAVGLSFLNPTTLVF